jgi:molybdopterin-guanine dinucleotide biosynthesis protein A
MSSSSGDAMAGEPEPAGETGFDAVVLAGGGARRLDGIDKPLLAVGGRTLLDRVLAACTAAHSTFVVGPRRPTYRQVGWLREEPALAGPAAALAVGVAAATRPWVVALAADLPFLDRKVIHSLWTHARPRDGSVLTDQDGRPQWLTACYRRDALLDRIARLGPAALPGLSLRRFVEDLDLIELPAPAEHTLDCDTWNDVEQARRLSRDRPEGPDDPRSLAG